MSNILAIAQKEIRAYFASPIAYVVIGLFALLFGYFYIVMVSFFVRESMQMSGFGGPQSLNVNQQVIRFVFQNVTVVFLFVLPMITMRTYAEEKRSGTVELLLTSPITDLQIILGKYLGAMTLYAAMLAVTLVHVGLLFVYGNPEWKPLLALYLGLLLFGGCFIALGLLVSSLTRNQIVAAMVAFVVFMLLWIVDWMSSFVGPTWEPILSYVSVVQHLDDFLKGVIDTKHIVYYLSFITFGLFLTAKAVDSERWRG
ncbi:MAG: ABC transporter permease subunit [Vicinamibacterales bacterium]